jgi:hypothetical protein
MSNYTADRGLQVTKVENKFMRHLIPENDN